MAEFCLQCLNKLMDTNDPPGKYILSDELDLCEECGEWTNVVVRMKHRYILMENFAQWRSDLKKRLSGK